MDDNSCPASTPDLREIQSQARVLIVDDDPGIRQVLQKLLSSTDFAVSTASNGKEAIRQMKMEPFSLLLVDLKMPEMGGMELLSEVRREWPMATVIMMTGYGTVETALDCMKLGAYDYILKPFKIQQVTKTLTQALSTQRIKEESFRLQEAVSLYQASEKFDESLSVDRILELTGMMARRACGADLCLLMVEDESSKGRLEYMDPIASGSFSCRMLWDVLLEAHTAKEPVLLQREDLGGVLDGEVEGIQACAAVPLRTGGKVLGSLAVVSMGNPKRFDEGHRRALAILAGRAASALENARLFDELKRLFKETVEGFAIALEAKDHYTWGHSERVRKYSRLVAIELKLDEAEVEQIGQAALLHDIGKLGIRSQALNKLGKLTDEEYQQVMSHPAQGKKILQPVSFLADILPIVHYHHERFDGEGYPKGLSGEDIPLGARILAVVDAYDAITSDRPYRKARSHQVALQELVQFSGTQFDPKVVEAFCSAVEQLHLTSCEMDKSEHSGLPAPTVRGNAQ